MATTNPSPKSAKIETRVTSEQKELIERAAAYTGRTISDFVVAHVEVAAKKETSRSSPPFLMLVPWLRRLRLGTHCSRGSAAEPGLCNK